MPAIRRVSRPGALAWLAVAVAWSAAAVRAAEPPSRTPAAEPRLTVVSRHVALERGEWLSWRVEYRLRNDGAAPLVVPPAALYARVEGWVANSRVEGHALPRSSAPTASGASGLAGTADVIVSDDEAHRCRERLVVQVWPESAGPEPPEPIARAVPPEEQPTLRLAPGAIARVRLRLEHQHPLYGPFEALLGTRQIELRLGPAGVRDRLPLDHPRPVAPGPSSWPPPPPAEFLDRRVFVSAPDSLHLEAHVPGKQSYRFPDLRGIRYGSRMRLSFWYLVAPGTEGPCQARLTQYRDLPGSWKALPDGEVVAALSTVGHWAHVERVFRVEPEATALTLDVRIAGADGAIGELWIDEVRLEPSGELDLAGP